MYQLLQSLAPNNEESREEESSQSDDEDVEKFVIRKQSMNQDNVIGIDFEKYNQMKPSPEIKRKIANLFMEFIESKDSEHAQGEFLTICADT